MARGQKLAGRGGGSEARQGEPAMVLVRFEYLRSDSERKLPRRNFYLLKIGAKSFRDESQDICKDTESSLGPFTGFQG